MSKRPELRTERLLLRPFTLDDAPTVKRLAGDRAVADTTLNIPHPYEEGMAEEWIGTHAEQFEEGRSVTFAIVLRASHELIGAIGLGLNQTHRRAEMGYWIGKPYWNNGYGTEAARAVLEYGFKVQQLNRIHASYFARNPASGRVMEKIGMKYEGCFRQHVQKWGEFQDLKVRAILKEEYEAEGSRG